MGGTEELLKLIRVSLWGGESCRADEQVFEQLCAQKLAALPAHVLGHMDMPDDLRARWAQVIRRQLAGQLHYAFVEQALPVTVPYAILKGSAAAKYYPHPELRAMGDIDLMTRREDFDAACGMLLDAGYTEAFDFQADGVMRHREFRKDHVTVEVHRYFARLNDPEASRYLDETIIDSIDDTHVLPDPVNGLVILEHIAQHLEEGLGLRQIIDWMMFADECLADACWEAFRPMARRVGLETLAVAVTHMCEIYLGLPERAWCRGADPAVCEELLGYVLACGNLGASQQEESHASDRALSAARSPRAFITLLQRHGMVTWKAAQRHAWLRPFAWLYQLGRYARKGLARTDALGRLREEADRAGRRNRLMDALGVGQQAKGYAVYRDGRYEK